LAMPKKKKGKGQDVNVFEKGSSGVDEVKLRKLFDEIDLDGGGTLDREEVAALAIRMGSPLTDVELDEAMADMDEDGSGDVDFGELKSWFARFTSGGASGGGGKLAAMMRQAQTSEIADAAAAEAKAAKQLYKEAKKASDKKPENYKKRKQMIAALEEYKALQAVAVELGAESQEAYAWPSPSRAHSLSRRRAHCGCACLHAHQRCRGCRRSAAFLAQLEAQHAAEAKVERRAARAKRKVDMEDHKQKYAQEIKKENDAKAAMQADLKQLKAKYKAAKKESENNSGNYKKKKQYHKAMKKYRDAQITVADMVGQMTLGVEKSVRRPLRYFRRPF
jgi:hypothetical protein